MYSGSTVVPADRILLSLSLQTPSKFLTYSFPLELASTESLLLPPFSSQFPSRYRGNTEDFLIRPAACFAAC